MSNNSEPDYSRAIYFAAESAVDGVEEPVMFSIGPFGVRRFFTNSESELYDLVIGDYEISEYFPPDKD